MSTSTYDPTPSPPPRSSTQRFDALGKANATRSRRSQLKRNVKAGREQIPSLLLSPPDWILSMKVYDLLLFVPYWRQVRAGHALKQCNISPVKTIGGLTERQRRELVAFLHRQGIGRTFGGGEEER